MLDGPGLRLTGLLTHPGGRTVRTRELSAPQAREPPLPSPSALFAASVPVQHRLLTTYWVQNYSSTPLSEELVEAIYPLTRLGGGCGGYRSEYCSILTVMIVIPRNSQNLQSDFFFFMGFEPESKLHSFIVAIWSGPGPHSVWALGISPPLA